MMYEIQIWFRSQEGGFLAEPHVVVEHECVEKAKKQYDSILYHDPHHIILVEYCTTTGDGDILLEWGEEE
jgi:hypothetical protein|tara:strand:+ start:2338 stop:2547 length:210 start_codon:yes stop_codon:yes gene_type:complete